MFPAAGLRDEAARSLAKRAIQEPGKADVLASNAGIYPFGPTRQVSGQDVGAVFARNVKARPHDAADLARAGGDVPGRPPGTVAAEAAAPPKRPGAPA